MDEIEAISFIAYSPEGGQFMRKLADGRWRITLDTEDHEQAKILSDWQHLRLWISIAPEQK
jgi:hypothetical protein